MNLLATTYGTISDIEILWILLALLGAIFSTYTSREAWLDIKALRKSRVGNGRLMLAKFSFQSEIARLSIQIIFLTLGILAALIPDVHNSGQPTKVIIISAVLRWGLIFASSLLTYKSFLARRLRIYFREHPEVYPPRVPESLPPDPGVLRPLDTDPPARP